jgi:hypothetical protein
VSQKTNCGADAFFSFLARPAVKVPELKFRKLLFNAKKMIYMMSRNEK